MKKRIYELSKELGIESKELLKILSDLGINFKSALNIIDKETEDIIKDLLKKEEPQKSPPKEEIKKEETDNIINKIEEKKREEKVITISGAITVRELAELLKVSPTNLILKLMEMKIMANINQLLEPDIVKKVGEKFGYKVEEIDKRKLVRKRELTQEELARL
jgi:translation initiation factor IF-2